MRIRTLGLSILLVFFVACQSHKPVPKDTIVIGVDLPPLQLDPRLATDAVSSKMKNLLFSGLMKHDDSLSLVPDVAKSYVLSDNDLRYEFTLRTDVLFHDGKKLTSADVKATYESMRDAKLVSPFQGALNILDHIEAPSPELVVFVLKKPFLPFLTSMTLGILREDQAYAYRNGKTLSQNEIIGTGPYELLPDQNDLNEKIELVRFEHYFGGVAKTPNLVVRVIQDNTLRAMELMKGRLDLVQNAIPYVLVPTMREQKNLRFTSKDGVNFNYLAFNFNNPYLKDRRVRQAIAFAIDRDKIIKYKLAGLGRMADSFLSPDHWAYNHQLKPFALDIQAARKLLDEAGFPDPDGDGPETRFDLVYKTSTNKERLEIVQLIAENLRAIGIGVIIRSYEFGTLSRDIRQGDFDVFTMTWVGISDPDIYYSICHSSQMPPVGTNRGHYVNQELDKLLDATRMEDDPLKRRELFQRVQEIAYDDFVYVPLWYDANFAVMNHSLSGYDVRPDASLSNIVNVVKN